MPYTDHRPPVPDAARLRARIPGWGVDVQAADRPAVPREQRSTGPGRGEPEQQVEHIARERSIEHARLTPVFGTTLPPRGLSGAIRRRAYAKHSEARAAHWLLLLAADRIDVWENHLRSWTTTRPDNPVLGTGLRAELRGHGLLSRLGRRRADLRHQWMDPLIVAGPWLLAAGGVAAAIGAARRRLSGRP